MKILLVTHSHIAGGAETVVALETEMLASKGHRIAHFVSQFDKGCTQEAEDYTYPGVKTKSAPYQISWKGKSLLSYYKLYPNLLHNKNPLRYYQVKNQLKACLQEFKPDVAHIHYFTEYFFNPSILKMFSEAGTPTVLTFHGPESVCPSGNLLKGGLVEPLSPCDGLCVREKPLGQSCHEYKCIPTPAKRSRAIRNFQSRYEIFPEAIDIITAPSNALSNIFRSSGCLPDERIVRLYNPGNPHFFKSNFIKTHPSERSYFFAVGRLEAAKGFYSLVEAFSKVPDIPLIIAGEGNDKVRMQNYIDKKRLTNITLAGWQGGESLWELYRNSYAVILPSLIFDNSPVVIQESFAHSKPIIGSRMGGIPEFVRHNQSGFLYNPGDQETLLQYVKELWDDSEKTRQMGNEANQIFQQNFHPDFTYQEHLQVFEAAIEHFKNKSAK